MTRSLIHSGCLILQRLTLSAWVGGAILFVITSVAEQVSPDFDSVIRDQLAALRFPWYYRTAAVSLGISLAASCGVALTTRDPRGRPLLILGLVLAALGIAVFDYRNVYQPLLAEITPPGKPRSQQFLVLHERSRKINMVHVGAAAVAALLACSDRRKPD